MKKYISFIMCTIALLSSNAFAQVAIDVTGANQAAIKIAVLPVEDTQNVKMDYVISSDLFKTGLFQPISPDSITDQPNTPAKINFANFNQLGAQYILMGRMINVNEGQFVLTEVSSKRQLFNQKITGGNLRNIAHQTADLVIEKLTGNKGSFAANIAYISEKNTDKGRTYSLVVADVDGANRRDIYTGKQPILSPTWSPNGKLIAFMTYANNQSQIMIQPLAGGQPKVLLSSDSTVSSPVWSPDTRELAISRSDNQGNMGIYLVNIANGTLQKVTNGSGINTEPSFSPDNRYIYFTSDRSGTPQIYRMNRNGGDTKRAVIGGNYSANSEVSPDGKALALTRQTGGSYQIGLYNLQDGQFKGLTKGRLDEGATFASNGLLLMYSTPENGWSVIKMVNLKGSIVQTLSEPNGRLRDPAWGPYVTE